MIQIHIGLPKTGTTSLQKRIHENSAVLENQGWLYPAEWTRKNHFAHHPLSLAVLNQDESSDDYISSFIRASSQVDLDILISSEGFTNCIQPRAIDRFIDFVDRCQAHRRAGILLVLRRMDNFLASMYLHSIKYGRQKMDLQAYIRFNYRWSTNFFSGLSQIKKRLPAVEFTYFKHGKSKDILDEIFSSLGLDECIDLMVSDRMAHNIRLGAKAQTFFLYFEDLKSKHKLNADRKRWLRAFENGDVAFPDEIFSYSILRPDESAHIRAYSLDMARMYGIDVYDEYFGADLADDSPYIQLNLEALLDREDIDWLREMDVRVCN